MPQQRLRRRPAPTAAWVATTLALLGAGSALAQLSWRVPPPRVPRTRLHARGGQVASSDDGFFWQLAQATDFREQLVAIGEGKAEDMGIFADECQSGGKRRFFVAPFSDYAEFSSALEEAAHHYEVIRADAPCWPYFDLEFQKAENPGRRDEEVMAEFRRSLAGFCKERGLPFDESMAVYMDSSTDAKFSFHVIVKAWACHNSQQAGAFAQGLVDHARERQQRGEEGAGLLFARGADGEEVGVVDTSVYSRNRCFRTLFQSKFGKDATLELSDGGAVVAAEAGRKEQVLASLASYVPAGSSMLSKERVPVKQSSSTSTDQHGVDEVDARLQGILEWLVTFWDDMRSEKEGEGCHNPTTLRGLARMPENDSYIVSMVNNRFCCQRGRSHKSNGVWFVINLKQGVVRQGCYDKADCGTATKAFEIPANLLHNFF